MPMLTELTPRRLITFVALGGLSFSAIIWLYIRQKTDKPLKQSTSIRERRSSKSVANTESDQKVEEQIVTSPVLDFTKNNNPICESPPKLKDIPVSKLEEEIQSSTLDLEVSSSSSIGDWSKICEENLEETMIVNQNQNITHLINERGDGESHTFNKAKSPSLNSDNSDDVGSADSGRASSGEHYSPRHDSYSELSTFPMYEFEIPHSLVGLIIGIKGKTIKELCSRSCVKMLIRKHHTFEKNQTHQVCTVEGKREYINKCLRMLRHRFPIERFPELNLQPILPAPLPSNPTGSAAPSMLVLPFNIRCEIFITSIIDLGHVFVNQNSHPSFTSLPLLDNYMRTLYSKSTGIPEVPKPMAPGILCAAPSHSGFVRAITCIVFEEEDEAIVRYVDHGGYARLPRADLKQIRTDFMALPFQSSECYLAHVSPVDGTTTWCSAANQLFNQYCMNKVIEGKVIGYNARDELPVVEFYVVDDKGKEIRFDELLLSKNYAKVSDPSSTRCEPKRNEKYSSEVQVFTP